MTTPSIVTTMTNYRNDLGEIRAYLNITEMRVKKWATHTVNVRTNMIAHLRVAAANLLPCEGLEIRWWGLSYREKRTSYFTDPKQRVVQSLQAIVQGDLDKPNSKPQPEYNQSQVMKMVRSLRLALKWLDHAPVNDGKKKTLSEHEATLTLSKLEGLSELTGNVWTLPLINGMPLARGLGGLYHVFEPEEMARDRILRLENASMSVVSVEGSHVRLHVEQNLHSHILRHLMECIPNDVIQIISSYAYNIYDLTLTLGKTVAYPDDREKYPLYTSDPRITSESDDISLAVNVIHSKIEEFRSMGNQPTTCGQWLGHFGCRVFGHVTLCHPVKRDIVLISYKGSSEIRVYDAQVSYGCVDAIGIEELNFFNSGYTMWAYSSNCTLYNFINSKGPK